MPPELEAGGVDGVNEVAFHRQRIAFDPAGEDFRRQGSPDQAARAQAEQAVEARTARQVFQAQVARQGCGAVGQGTDQGQPVRGGGAETDLAAEGHWVQVLAGTGQDARQSLEVANVLFHPQFRAGVIGVGRAQAMDAIDCRGEVALATGGQGKVWLSGDSDFEMG